MKRPPAVGDTFTLVRQCDQYRPIYYAAASGDFNPIHIDAAAGARAGLGGAILQGLCTLGWAVDCFIQYVGNPVALKRMSVRFSKPVAIEDTITFTGRVIAIENGLLKANIEAKNQRGEDVLTGAMLEGAL